MGVGKYRDQGAGAEEIQGGRDIVAALIPEIGKAQKSEMAEKSAGKGENIDGRQGQCPKPPLPIFFLSSFRRDPGGHGFCRLLNRARAGRGGLLRFRF